MYARKEWQALASAAQSLMCVAQTAAAAHDIEGCVDVLALAQKYARRQHFCRQVERHTHTHTHARTHEMASRYDLRLN